MARERVVILTGDYGAQHAKEPYQILRTFGYDVDFISPERNAGDTVKMVYHWEEAGEQSYRERPGRDVVISRDFEDVSASDYAGLVIPGARAPEYLSTRADAIELVRDFDELGKPIAGICHGPLLLAAADVVAGVRCTGIPATRPWLELAGAEWVEPKPADKETFGKSAAHLFGVVTDGNIITVPLRVEFPEVMRELLRQIEGADEVTVRLDGPAASEKLEAER